MRYIKTTNSQIEFIEATADGNVLSSIGLQLGEVYFQIKNKKATFYLNDSERPFDNYIWSIDVPLTIDGEVYSTEEEASAALSAIMNDSFQEQLDQLKEDLAAEEARAQEAEEQLEDKIDDESARAIAAENRLQDQVTELSGAVAVLDNRVTDVENDLSALTDTVNDEITRSTAKDVSHDALISGLTTNLQNEINRATSAENSLRNDLNAEIQNRIDSISGLTERVADDEAAFGAALVDLNNKINAVSGENASQNVQISGLNNSINTEISRATSVENALRSDLNDEISRATTKENQLDDKIDFEIANRIADVNVEENRAIAAEQALDSKIDNEITRSTAKDASHDTLISGLTTNLQNEINRATSVENALRSDLTNETSARTNADAAMLERIVAVEVGKADANSVYTKVESDNKYATKDYISGLTDEFQVKLVAGENISIVGNVISAVGGGGGVTSGQVQTMIDESISGKADSDDVYTKNEVYTKAEVDEAIDDIDLSSYYTKSEVDASQLAQDNKINAISGNVQTLNGKVDTISGDIITIQGEIDDIDLSNYYTKGESDGKYQLKGDYVTGAQMSAFTYDKQTIDDKIAQGGTFDPTQYYNKTATDALLANKADLSGLTSHTANTNIHVTSAEKNTWNNKSDFSGNYNDLANKPTIHTYTAGTGIDITNDVISVTGGSQPVDAYTKAESDAKFATITNFNSHSGNTTMHVTASEKSTWNNKSDFSGNYNDLTNKPTIPNYTAGDGITISNNVISAKIWSGTQAQYDAITTKDSSTIYLIYS